MSLSGKPKPKFVKRTNRLQVFFFLYDEVLLYSNQVVIPTTLQRRIQKDFHASYPGITRMICVYWPNMDKDIENIVKSCKDCAFAAKVPPNQI